jgi:hypothetical protein
VGSLFGQDFLWFLNQWDIVLALGIVQVVLWMLFLLSFSPRVFAQETPSPATSFMQSVCAKDVELFCGHTAEPTSVVQCLGQNKDNLSETCKEGLQRFAQASQQARSRGGGALGAFGGMNAFSAPVPMLTIEGRLFPANHSPRMTEQRANISFPVYRTEKETLSMSAAYGLLNFQESVTLDSGVSVPTNLRRVELGAQYFRQKSEKRNWGIRGSIGYSGDTVFKNSRDLTFSANAHYGYPGSGNGYWILTVFFANNSPLGNFVPIPGFFYMYRTEHFTGLFGLPIATMQWTPAFPWSFSMSLFGPTLMSEAAYGSIEQFQVFTGFQWTQQQYLLEARVREEDRLRLEEKKFLVGVRTPVFKKLNAEIQVGHGFDRSLYIGDGLFDKQGGAADLDANMYFQFILRAIL